jgi:hypothetical protein
LRKTIDLIDWIYVMGLCGIEVKQMAENKMKQVAELFGKKIGESFKVKSKGITKSAYFSYDGLWLDPDDGFRNINHPWLIFLLTGEAEIVEE